MSYSYNMKYENNLTSMKYKNEFNIKYENKPKIKYEPTEYISAYPSTSQCGTTGHEERDTRYESN